MEELAFKLFKLSSSGFCCTQIMLKLALDDEGKENEDLIRAVNGLCRGIGDSQKTCGVLLGAIAVLGLYGGKGNEKEFVKENYSAMMDEFSEWFYNEFGSTECVDLIGVTDFKGADSSYKVKCGELLTKSYTKLYEIITENGYEFGNRE